MLNVLFPSQKTTSIYVIIKTRMNGPNQVLVKGCVSRESLNSKEKQNKTKQLLLNKKNQLQWSAVCAAASKEVKVAKQNL